MAQIATTRTQPRQPRRRPIGPPARRVPWSCKAQSRCSGWSSRRSPGQARPRQLLAQLAGEQMIQNIEVMGKLATSRHWPEALVIQQGFAQASYARLARGMTCHLGWSA